jgi:pimeloyl-ACP methyl ester carboxylesterase
MRPRCTLRCELLNPPGLVSNIDESGVVHGDGTYKRRNSWRKKICTITERELAVALAGLAPPGDVLAAFVEDLDARISCVQHVDSAVWAGVDIHGVHDWNEGIRIFVPSYSPDEATERLAFESSPNSSLDTWRSPVLLIHGDDDRNVFFSQTVYLVEALRDRDVHVEQLVFPDEVHGFLLHRNWVRAYEATLDFFNRTLRKR